MDVNARLLRDTLHDTWPLLPLWVIVCLALFSCAGYAMPVHRARPPVAGAARHAPPLPSPTSRSLPTATPTATLAPTPTQAALPGANAERGCTPRAPRPYPSTIFTAFPQGGTRQMPAEVALTFDDGPSESTTPRFLDYLEQTHTPATFFVIGNQAQQAPDLIRREWREGFTIGVHTWNHPDMTKLTVAQMRFQLSSTLHTLHATLGPSACIWLWRPPYGAVNSTVRTVAASYGLTGITWDDDGFDYERPGVNAIASRILSEVHAGSIILLHDGPALRDQTLAALPLILSGLRARHLTPVSLPQLLADDAYPGVHVAHALQLNARSGRRTN